MTKYFRWENLETGEYIYSDQEDDQPPVWQGWQVVEITQAEYENPNKLWFARSSENAEYSYLKPVKNDVVRLSAGRDDMEEYAGSWLSPEDQQKLEERVKRAINIYKEIEDEYMRRYDEMMAQREQESLANPDGIGSMDTDDYRAAIGLPPISQEYWELQADMYYDDYLESRSPSLAYTDGEGEGLTSIENIQGIFAETSKGKSTLAKKIAEEFAGEGINIVYIDGNTPMTVSNRKADDGLPMTWEEDDFWFGNSPEDTVLPDDAYWRDEEDTPSGTEY